MIVPPYEAKCYGAVHIDNYLSFIGFCKKVYSDEVCKVDVFLDDERIDSITCDKTVDKIEQIYEIGSHCFKYELDDKYFDKRHMLSFKCDGEELLHSPIETISKDDEKYNEYKFLHSLENTDYEELKDVYKPNSIGFLATRENLEDEEFVGYIKELMERFPDVEFVGFCFNLEQEEQTQKILNQKIQTIIPENIYDIASNIEIYIYNNNCPQKGRKLLYILKYFCTSLITIQFSNNMKMDFLSSPKLNHPAFTNPELFGTSISELKRANNNFDTYFYSKYTDLSINNKSSYELLCFDAIEFILFKEGFKYELQKMHRCVMEVLNLVPSTNKKY